MFAAGINRATVYLYIAAGHLAITANTGTRFTAGVDRSTVYLHISRGEPTATADTTADGSSLIFSSHRTAINRYGTTLAAYISPANSGTIEKVTTII